MPTIPSDLEISTDRSRIDVDLVHGFLSQSYWAKGRSRAVVERSIANSLCFGAYVGGKQVGFGRVVTDYAVFGYVADVFVVPVWQGKGIGKALVRAMVEHPDIVGLQVTLLRSADARSLYVPFGFRALPKPEEMMGRYATVTIAGTPQDAMPALPSGVREYKRTATFNEDKVPAGLLRDHRTKEGVWALIVVESGTLEYTIEEPLRTFLLTPALRGVIPPVVPHRVKVLGPVTFHVEFLAAAQNPGM